MQIQIQKRGWHRFPSGRRRRRKRRRRERDKSHVRRQTLLSQPPIRTFHLEPIFLPSPPSSSRFKWSGRTNASSRRPHTLGQRRSRRRRCNSISIVYKSRNNEGGRRRSGGQWKEHKENTERCVVASRQAGRQACAYNHFLEFIRPTHSRRKPSFFSSPLLNSLYALSSSDFAPLTCRNQAAAGKKEIWQWTRNRDRLEDHSFPP